MSLLRLRGRCYNYGTAIDSLSRWRVFSVLSRWRTSSPSDRAPRRPGAPRRRCRAATFRASHSFLAGRVIDAAHREWRTVHEQPPAPDGDAAGECRHLCRQQRRRRWRRREGIGVTRRVAAPCSSRGYCPARWGSSCQRARGARRVQLAGAGHYTRARRVLSFVSVVYHPSPTNFHSVHSLIKFPLPPPSSKLNDH